MKYKEKQIQILEREVKAVQDELASTLRKGIARMNKDGAMIEGMVATHRARLVFSCLTVLVLLPTTSAYERKLESSESKQNKLAASLAKLQVRH